MAGGSGYANAQEWAGDCLDVKAGLPRQVFKGYGSFAFLEFRIANPQYWSFLCRLAAWSGDDRIGFASTDPDSFVSAAGGRGAYELPVTASAEEYHAAIAAELPTGNIGYFYAAAALAWLPPSREWAIWGERDYSTLVVGFRKPPEPTFEEMARGSGLRPQAMDEILDLVKNDFDWFPGREPKPEHRRMYEAYADEFRRNYGR